MDRPWNVFKVDFFLDPRIIPLTEKFHGTMFALTRKIGVPQLGTRLITHWVTRR